MDIEGIADKIAEFYPLRDPQCPYRKGCNKACKYNQSSKLHEVIK